MKKTKTYSYKKSSGFTLMEVIMVVVIMGVLAAMAIPSYTRMITRNHIEKAARSFESTLVKAQQHAFVSGRPVTVCPVADVTDEASACATWAALSDAANNGLAGWIAFNDRDGDLVRDVSAPANPAGPATLQEIVFDKSTFDPSQASMQWTNGRRPNIILTPRNTSGTSGTMRVFSPNTDNPLPNWVNTTQSLSEEHFEIRVRLSSLGRITYER